MLDTRSLYSNCTSFKRTAIADRERYYIVLTSWTTPNKRQHNLRSIYELVAKVSGKKDGQDTSQVTKETERDADWRMRYWQGGQSSTSTPLTTQPHRCASHWMILLPGPGATRALHRNHRHFPRYARQSIV